MSKPRVERVTWEDAQYAFSESDIVRKRYKNRTVGWVRESKRYLFVSQERTGGGEWRGVTRIPKRLVLKRRRLT